MALKKSGDPDAESGRIQGSHYDNPHSSDIGGRRKDLSAGKPVDHGYKKVIICYNQFGCQFGRV